MKSPAQIAADIRSALDEALNEEAFRLACKLAGFAEDEIESALAQWRVEKEMK